jgi:hypothetical protein
MKKVTGGFGIFNGENIDPIEPEPENTFTEKWADWNDRKVYLGDLVPREFAYGGIYHGKTARYIITIEVEPFDVKSIPKVHPGKDTG